MGRRRPAETESLAHLDEPPPKWLEQRTERECVVHVDVPFYRDPPADMAEANERHRERHHFLPRDIGRRRALAWWAEATQEQRALRWEEELKGWNRGVGERWPHTVVAWCDEHDRTAWQCEQAGLNCKGRTHDLPMPTDPHDQQHRPTKENHP